MKSQLKRIGPISLILIAILVVGSYMLYGTGENADAWSVSGTVQVVEVVISSEVGGRIGEVMVEEGDNVRVGDVLIRFEDELLQAQRDQAIATLNQAHTEYSLIANQPMKEQRQLAITTAQIELLQAQQALQELIDNADLARALAQQAIEDAEQNLEDLLSPELQQALALENIVIAEQAIDDAEKYLIILSSPPPQFAIDQAYGNMLMAENKVNKTLVDIELAKQKQKLGPKRYWPKEIRSEYRSQFRRLIKNLEIKLAWEQLAYQNATEKYSELLKSVDPIDLALADADLAIAQAQLTQAQREYDRIKDGPNQSDIAVLEAQIDFAKREYEALNDGLDPEDLAFAQTRFQSAKANLALAQSDTRAEQLAVVQAQIEAAEAALSVLQTRLNKLVLTAPVDGTVLQSFVETGEVVDSGKAVVTLANLTDLTITVYIPAYQYKEIKLGDQAMITVNAFTDEIFYATVTHFTEQIGYTPLNIEDRFVNTFAVVLTINDPDGKIKPGMPAEVIFGN
jgi:HlyD family secretion protein